MSIFFLALVVLAAQPGEETSATVPAVPSVAAAEKPILMQRTSRRMQVGGGRQPIGNRGRPGGLAARLPGQGNIQNDAGPELVELIQKTISPAHWNVNGGPGSIYYWRPGRALVIMLRTKSTSRSATRSMNSTAGQ